MALIDGWSSCCCMNLKTIVSRMHCCPDCCLPNLAILSLSPAGPSPPNLSPLGATACALIHWIPGLLLLTTRYLKNSLNSENNKRVLSQLLILFISSLLQPPQGAGTTKWQEWKHWATLKCSTSNCQILSIWRMSWRKVQLSLYYQQGV